MSVFAIFTLLITSLFSLYALAFAYTVEDQFFEAMLASQAQEQLAYFARNGEWPTISDPNLKRYLSIAEMPEELASVLEREPKRKEIAGAQGRHYHLHSMALASGEKSWLVAEVSQQLVFRSMRSVVLEILLFSALGALMTALLLAWYLARNTALPISSLSAQLAQMQPEQLPAQLPQNTSLSEVGVLTRGLNRLILRVREFVEREQNFTRDVSHELRTPLSVIQCAAEQLIAQEELGSAAKIQLGLILQGSVQLQQTISTLLSIVREAHCSHASAATCRVLPVLERVVIEQAPLLGDKAIELTLDIDERLHAQIAEPILHIVLSNLLGNAFAHSEPDSSVRVWTHNRRLVIGNLSHNGLSAQAAEAFHKHPASTGLGLGLSIVQRLSDRYDLALRLTQEHGFIQASFALAGCDTNPV